MYNTSLIVIYYRAIRLMTYFVAASRGTYKKRPFLSVRVEQTGTEQHRQHYS